MNKLQATLITHVVTYNNEDTILPCLRSLIEQDGLTLGENYHIIVSDNNSADKTCELIEAHYADKVQLVRHKKNLGFCRAHNLCFSQANSANVDYVFIANPDLRMEATALSELVLALEADPSAGVACPRLYRADAELAPVKPLKFDTTGMYITPGIRHFDRGSNELAENRYEEPEYVFGASGAAALFRKDFLTEVALPVTMPLTMPIAMPSAEGATHLQVFDEAFFAYREDADLAWRSQLLGWKCRYQPSAIGYHKRHVLPEKRKKLASELNSMSVRNRFLLQLNNLSPTRNLKCLLPALLRNVLVIGASCTVEPSSFQGLKQGLKELPSALKKRADLKKRKSKSARDLNPWFSNSPHSEPAPSFVKAVKIESLEIVIVNYNSGDRLGRCTDRVIRDARQLGTATRITIIDNASSDTSATRVARKHKKNENLNFRLLKNNLGFAGAINYAARETTADAMLILNPDIEVKPKCIREQINALDQHKELGAVGPVLIGIDGKVQDGFLARRFPSLGSSLAELFFLHRIWPSNPWTARYLYHGEHRLAEHIEGKTSLPYFVDQPAGCCLMVRGEAFKKLNGFDTRFYPAWFEDVDFCKRLAENNYRCAIIASARATHEGGYSYKNMRSVEFYRIWYKNLARYFRKHASIAQYAIFRTLLVPALIIRSAIALLAGGFRQEKRELAKGLFALSLGVDHQRSKAVNE